MCSWRSAAPGSDTALIGLGSNLGDPARQLRAARLELARLGEVVRASGLYRSPAQGGPSGQPDYLNAVVELAPAPPYAAPGPLLRALLAIEAEHGRVRRERWAARTLDLDLLAFGPRVVDTEGLVLPHPRMMGRSFVLAPLCEIAPEWRHPLTEVSACEALRALEGDPAVRTGLGWEPGAAG